MLLILNFSTLTFITYTITTMPFARLHSEMVCTQSEPAEIILACSVLNSHASPLLWTWPSTRQPSTKYFGCGLSLPLTHRICKQERRLRQFSGKEAARTAEAGAASISSIWHNWLTQNNPPKRRDFKRRFSGNFAAAPFGCCWSALNTAYLHHSPLECCAAPAKLRFLWIAWHERGSIYRNP